MKLLSKYNQVNIAATTTVLLVGCVCYYFILHFILLQQLDNDLKIEQQEIIDFVKQNNVLPEAVKTKDQIIFFDKASEVTKNIFTSKRKYSEIEKERITIRQLTFTILLNHKIYKTTIEKSQEETEDLMGLILAVAIGILLLLLLVLFFINRFILNKLWHPFNNTLHELKKFKVKNQLPIKLKNNNIDEFTELNTAVTNMSIQVLSDYGTLKNFTENASHEIQTPLAIIKTKLELLIQAENFSENQMQYVEIINNEVARLSKLNKSLLLLTKIDNQQFADTENINIATILHEYLVKYEELIVAKNIMLKTEIQETVQVVMNETLAAILISNLITNAIKHNNEVGTINIILENNKLQISNTGKEIKGETTVLFERFKKDTNQTDSLGLGLSIVQKICERNHFSVDYRAENQLHILTVNFEQV